METSKELKELIKPNINEGALEQYLMARGINPKFVSTQTKISHAKSSAFIKWKNDHMHENHIAISMGKMLDDEGSMVLNQIEELERGCAMIREYIGKDYEKQLPAWVQSKVTLATDYMSTVGNYLSSKNEKMKEEIEFQEASHDPWKDKHFGPTKIIKQKYHVKTDTKSFNVKADNEDHAHKLVTKHAPGSKIVSIEHKGRMMEEVEQIDELSKSTLSSYLDKKKSEYMKGKTQSGSKENAKDIQNMGKAYDKMKKEEVVSEVSSELLDRYKEKAKKSADELTAKGQHKKSTDRWMGVMKATGKQIDKTTDNIRKTLSKEEVVYETKKDDGYTKSARMIKALYGKLPKTKTSDTKNNVGDKAQAAAVLTGGKTLTGQTRDTLEIDPIMRKGDPLELQKQQKNLR
jgi:hypothetical protein